MLSFGSRLFSKTSAFNVTKAAAEQIKSLLKDDFENRYMRIGLKGGGCSGFQYDFSFISKPSEGDHVFGEKGAQVVLDNHALLYLRNSTLDFIKDPFSSSFTVVLPEDTTLNSCSCGRSVGTENNPGACSHDRKR